MSYCRKFARAKTLIHMPKLKGCFAQYKIWNEVMLWLKNMMGYNTVPLLISQMNDVEENLNCSIFDVPDLTVIFCKLQHA